MIKTTDKYTLVYLVTYYICAINSSAPAGVNLITYATTTLIASTKMEGIHAAIQAAATS